jgi:SGNH domain-containing protein
VVGTLLLLGAGTGQTNIVSRALTIRPLVKVGDWSYSIYLWHWPLIVFASLRWPDRRWGAVAAAVVSFAPALASYRWVETPLRQLGGLTRAAVAKLVVAVLAPVMALSVSVLYAADRFWAPRLNSADVTTAFHGEVAWKDHDYKSGGYQPCTDPDLRTMVEKAHNSEPRCQQSKPGPDVDMALLGDSHAEHIFIGLLEALPATNIMYFTANAFPSKSNSQYAAALNYVNRTPSIKTVILTAFWGGRDVDEPVLVEVLRSLVNSGKNVLITDDVPNFGFDPFGCKVHTTGCSQPLAQSHYTPKLLSVTRQVPGVRLMRTAKYLCNKKECSMTLGEDILYADPSHLNILGSRYVGRRIVEEYGTWLN